SMHGPADATRPAGGAPRRSAAAAQGRTNTFTRVASQLPEPRELSEALAECACFPCLLHAFSIPPAHVVTRRPMSCCWTTGRRTGAGCLSACRAPIWPGERPTPGGILMAGATPRVGPRRGGGWLLAGGYA